MGDIKALVEESIDWWKQWFKNIKIWEPCDVDAEGICGFNVMVCLSMNGNVWLREVRGEGTDGCRGLPIIGGR